MKIPRLVLCALPILFFACGSDSGAGGDAGNSCSPGETRCSDSAFQECKGGTFKDTNICAGSTVCSPSLGCTECLPEAGSTCVGDTVHFCQADGTIGDSRQQCQPGTCSRGSCESGGGNACGASGTELIYVVDDSENFLSFDPAKLGPGGNPFTLIGKISCPAGPPIGGGFDEATPFSMSVDRNGTAWVLYNSGQIFHVSTTDASCQSTSWIPGSNGFELFGMGFVSDAEDSELETLYIAGGDADNLSNGNLGSINSANLQVTTIGSLPVAEQSPELTGTGEAKLYGYFPGSFTSFVANLDKTTGAQGQRWDAPAVPGGVSAWAFAHWGGRFYIFATGGQLTQANAVYEVDPVAGSARTVIPSTPYRVVGAGVSTCAPTQID